MSRDTIPYDVIHSLRQDPIYDTVYLSEMRYFYNLGLEGKDFDLIYFVNDCSSITKEEALSIFKAGQEKRQLQEYVKQSRIDAIEKRATEPERETKRGSKKSLTQALSDIASGAAGVGLYIAYMVFLFICAFLPIYVVSTRYIPQEIIAALLTLLFVFWFMPKYQYVGSVLQFAFWIWGFVLIVSGKSSFDGWRSILYYILFAINIIWFIIKLLSYYTENNR